MHVSKRNDFDKGWLYLVAASFKRHCIVLSLTVTPVFLNLFGISRSVTNVSCLPREAISSSCLGVVARGRSDQIELNLLNLLPVSTV